MGTDLVALGLQVSSQAGLQPKTPFQTISDQISSHVISLYYHSFWQPFKTFPLLIFWLKLKNILCEASVSIFLYVVMVYFGVF